MGTLGSIMTSRQLFVCEYCGKKDIKSEKGLRQHQQFNLDCAKQKNALLAKLLGIKGSTRVLRTPKSTVSLPKNNVQNSNVDTADGNECVEDPMPLPDDDAYHVQMLFEEALEDLDDSTGSDGGSISDDDSESGVDDSESGVDEEPQAGCSREALDDFRAYVAHAERHFMPFTRHERAAISLMDTLRKKKATLDTYDAVMMWHYRETGKLGKRQGLGKAKDFIPRKKLMKKLAKRYNVNPNFIHQAPLTLPSSKTKVNVIWNHARDCVVSLLTDPRFSDDDFLHFANDPLAPPPDDLDYISDVNTGLSYSVTYKQLITNPQKQMLVPIILYIDGAITGQFGKLEVEPLKMSIGILNRAARDKEYGWRTLGYVPDYTKAKSRSKKMFQETGHAAAMHVAVDDGEGEAEEEDPQEEIKKAQDYHSILTTLLKSVKEVIQEGMVWDYKYRGQLYTKIEMVFYIAFIKCDGEEADKLCGKYLSRTKKVAQLCRYCCCPTGETDDHLGRWAYKTEPMIQALVDKDKEVALKKLSQHNIENAFYGTRFGLHNDRGVHGACPLELLHALLLGLYMYMRDCFFAQIGPTSKQADEINALAKLYGEQFTRQSDRDLPKTNFSKGISKGKIMAKEFSGVMLNMAAILASAKGKELLQKVRKPHFKYEWQIKDWSLLVEKFLQWEAYLKLEVMQKDHVKRLQKKHRSIMFLIKKIGRRERGMGFQLMKYHGVMHMAMDILMFGVPMVFDTGSNESHHKPMKAAAKCTQRDLRVFEAQVAKRLVEFFMLDLAMLEMEGMPLWEYFVEYADDDSEEVGIDDTNQGNEPANEDKPKTIGTKIEVFWDDDDEEVGFVLAGSRMQNVDKVRWDYNVQEFLFNVQEALFHWVSPLEIRTEHHRKGHIFRGHPQYRQMGMWNDWALFDWGNHGNLPGEIWCFVDLSMLPGDVNVPFAQNRLYQGIFAVIESSNYEENAGMSDLFIPFVKEAEQVGPEKQLLSRRFYLADVEAILEAITVVPDVGHENKLRYFHVKPRKDWAAQFMQWIEMPHNQDPLVPAGEAEQEEDDC